MRADQENNRHQRKDRDLGHLGCEQRRHAHHHADEKAGDHGAADRTHPADDGDDKRLGKNGRAHLGNDALQRRGEKSGKSRDRTADPEHVPPDARHIDPENANDLRIPRAGPNDQAEAGALQEQPEPEQDRRGHADHEQSIKREIANADIDRALQKVRRIERIAALAEGDANKFDHHVAEAERQQQRIIDAPTVERTDQKLLDDHSQRADDQRHGDQAQPKLPPSETRKSPA